MVTCRVENDDVKNLEKKDFCPWVSPHQRTAGWVCGEEGRGNTSARWSSPGILEFNPRETDDRGMLRRDLPNTQLDVWIAHSLELKHIRPFGAGNLSSLRGQY